MTNTITLSPDQKTALDKCMQFLADPSQHEMVITGGPGTGKSFLVDYLIKHIKIQYKLDKTIGDVSLHRDNVVCTATTNKAATVLADFTKGEATTIHSFLGLILKNNYKDGTTTLVRKGDTGVKQHYIIIVDESSYIDKNLLNKINEICFRCKIIYIGDEDQLINVKQSSCPVFTDISNKVYLNTIHRFDTNSGIYKHTQLWRDTIKTGVFHPFNPNGVDIISIPQKDMENTLNKEFSNKDKESKVIAWSNKKVIDYNIAIRSFFTSSPVFIPGEKVVTNTPIFYKKGVLASTDEEVIIEDIRKINPTKYTLSKDIDSYAVCIKGVYVDMPADRDYFTSLLKYYKQTKDWKRYFELKEDYVDLRPSYAATVYKAQGASYDNVFIDLTNLGKCTQSNIFARMMYVAISRAKEKIYLFGELPSRYKNS